MVQMSNLHPASPRATVLALQVGNRPGPRICPLARAGGLPGDRDARARALPGPVAVLPLTAPDALARAIARSLPRGDRPDLPHAQHRCGAARGPDERALRLLRGPLAATRRRGHRRPERREQFDLVCDKGNPCTTPHGRRGSTHPARRECRRLFGLRRAGLAAAAMSVVKPRWAPAEGRGVPLRRSAVSVSTPAEPRRGRRSDPRRRDRCADRGADRGEGLADPLRHRRPADPGPAG